VCAGRPGRVLVRLVPAMELRVTTPAAEIILPAPGVVMLPLAVTLTEDAPLTSAYMVTAPAFDRTSTELVPVTPALIMMKPPTEVSFTSAADTVPVPTLLVILPAAIRSKVFPAEDEPPPRLTEPIARKKTFAAPDALLAVRLTASTKMRCVSPVPMLPLVEVSSMDSALRVPV